MFGHPPFYNKIIRKITIAFGNIFNQIEISRLDSDGEEAKRIKVPIIYGPKEKWYYRVTEEPELTQKKEIVVPRMSFRIVAVDYDGARKLNTMHQNLADISTTLRKKQFVGVPYDIGFELVIAVRNADDGAQIIEQIIPYFPPSYDVTINAIPELDLKDDVPIILKQIATSDMVEGAPDGSRELHWTLNFIAKANFYGPIKSQGPIRDVKVNLRNVPGGGEITDAEIEAEPAITAQIEIQPDPLDSDGTGDFGFTIDINEYP